ncbi:ADAM 17-like protease isoform X2 [Adelges cooleyi]|uniref:ADAM 17-like protease isoform X2 n=1 Tax=Adelges cooleyi TaxID=133065 RepID=UPI00217FC128|nr:ADAM 17-like protease isoform X2 [Adelges cooleyi]
MVNNLIVVFLSIVLSAVSSLQDNSFEFIKFWSLLCFSSSLKSELTHTKKIFFFCVLFNMKVLYSILLFLLTSRSIQCSIYKNLKYFDTLHASDLSHNIVKRGATDSPHPLNKIKEVSFYTLGRHFRLILSPKRDLLHHQFEAISIDGEGVETPVTVDHDHFYNGRVFGETSSHASVHLDKGVMTAIIDVPGETYHIEPSWRHLPDRDNKTMVTYKASDVRLSWEQSEKKQHKPCAYVKEDAEVETVDDDDDDLVSITRNKREADSYNYVTNPTKTRCPLLLVADYRFFREMGGGDTKTTINYLISLIDRVHKIYNDTLWFERQESDGFRGMGFVIKKITVHSAPTKVHSLEDHYNMVKEKWDVRSLLEVFSRDYSHKDFCLAHLFTDLKFEGGILGLAYVGSPRRNSVGGICTPEYFKNGYTLYLNSGLSSSRNHYGQRVITREADLVTAHEFGHNWGSEHDPDIKECSPTARKGGSFLMYTYSVSGYDINNKRFSPCSLRSIRKVLQAKSERCFSEPEESFCGNLRVEGNEECDAGLLGTEDNDLCCDKSCKLRKAQGARCSDKNSPCCQNCQFMAPGVKCREGQFTTCEQESSCTGNGAECPKSLPMADGTGCLERGKCRSGKCISFCETIGLQSCMCDKILQSCIRCCRMNLNDTCSPVDPLDILPDGTPCVQGFCNKGVCEKTIQDVVERFWDIIEEININKMLRFFKDNIVGTVILVTSLIWVPASCLINWLDHKRAKEARERRHREEDNNELVQISNEPRPKKIIYIKVATNQNESDEEM